MDPFAVLGMQPAVDIDGDELERRFLERSRQCHPDHQRTEDAAEQVAILERAAELNEAYRLLRDPWKRIAALLELRAPGILEANKQLDPMFLMEAMELAERVEDASAGDRESLRAKLDELLEGDWAAIRAAAGDSDWATAATRLHQTRYHRNARQRLEAGR